MNVASQSGTVFIDTLVNTNEVNIREQTREKQSRKQLNTPQTIAWSAHKHSKERINQTRCLIVIL